MSKIQKNKIISFILIYSILLFYSGFFFYEYATSIGIIVVLGMIVIYSQKFQMNHSVFERYKLVILIIVITEMVASFIFPSGIAYKSVAFTIITLTLSLLLVSTVHLNDFISQYINCMLVISLLSFILYFLSMIDTNLIAWLPKIINSKGRVGNFAVFSIWSDFGSEGHQRNQGIFWEPGAFQIFLCIAYILEYSQKRRNMVLMIFLITIFSTISTTGIVVAASLGAFTLIRYKKSNFTIKVLSMILLMSFVIYLIWSRIDGYWRFAIVEKLHYAFHFQYGESSIASARIISIYSPLENFIKSPILGIGTPGYEVVIEKLCTPINWVVFYGPVVGCLIFKGLYNFFLFILKDKIDAILLLMIFLLSVSTEAVEFNLLILCIIFYGWKIKGNTLSYPSFVELEMTGHGN